MAHFEIAADIAMCEHTPKVNLIAYLASSDKFYFDHYKTINFKTKYRVEGGGLFSFSETWFWLFLKYLTLRVFSKKKSKYLDDFLGFFKGAGGIFGNFLIKLVLFQHPVTLVQHLNCNTSIRR